MSENNLDAMERPLMDVLRDAGLVDQNLDLIDKKLDTVEKKINTVEKKMQNISKKARTSTPSAKDQEDIDRLMQWNAHKREKWNDPVLAEQLRKKEQERIRMEREAAYNKPLEGDALATYHKNLKQYADEVEVITKRLERLSYIAEHIRFPEDGYQQYGQKNLGHFKRGIDAGIKALDEYKKKLASAQPVEGFKIESPFEDLILRNNRLLFRECGAGTSLFQHKALLDNKPLTLRDLSGGEEYPRAYNDLDKTFAKLRTDFEGLVHTLQAFKIESNLQEKYASNLWKTADKAQSKLAHLDPRPGLAETAGPDDYYNRKKHIKKSELKSAQESVDEFKGRMNEEIIPFLIRHNATLNGTSINDIDLEKLFAASGDIGLSLLNPDLAWMHGKFTPYGLPKNADIFASKFKKQDSTTADQIAETKKVEEATTSATKETTQALAAEASKRVEDTRKVEEATIAETKKANTDIVADTKNTTDQNAATYRAMQKQQAADATVLARSLNRIQNEESKTRIENLKQQNSLARIDAKSTADKSLETQRQNGKLEVENAKAVAKEKELAAKEAAREKAAADKAATDAIKHQNQLELENIKQQHRLELEHEKDALRDARDERKRAEREKANAVKQSAREELEETRRIEREKRELERESERAKRDIKRALAQEQKEQEKREKQAAKDKEKAEKDAAKAAAQAEKDAAKKAEEAAKTKKEAWQIVGNAIKKVADIVKNSLSKALSLVKKDIQLTVSLVKKGVDLFKSAGNTILRILNLFGNFGDRLRSLFSGGIINGVIKGFNGLLNTVADVPNKILDNRFVQVGESLLSSIQSLNILIGKDLTESTIAWANELERGFGLSADGLIADMRGVAGVLKGLGMDGGDTATASKNLAIMSRSFSVMLGYKPEEAMSKIESGMKGMTQSVDDLGISVREAEMNSFLKDLKARGGDFAGIATSFSNLNEEQRVYVRYAAMIDQYLKAFSIEKYAKSLDTITGRLSILRERTRAFMSAVGNLFIQLFNKIIVPLTYAIDVITQKIKALTSFLGLSSELSADMNGMTDAVGTTIDTSGSVKELGKEAKALDDVSKAAKEAKGGIDSFDHITSMRSSSSSGSSKSGDGADGSDFDYSKLMDLNADDLAKRMEEMSKTMEDHTNSYKNKVKDGLTKIREAIDTWYTGQTGSKIDWNKIFNLSDFKKATEGMGKSIARSGKAIKDTFGVLVIKFAQDINLNRVLSKSLGLINEALGALADILDFLKPILIELYDEIISPIVKDLGDKVATALDGIRAKLVQFRDDLASGKYSNFKIVLKTLITGETSADDMGALRTGDEENSTSLSRLNTIAEKIHTVFADIYTLVKSTASVIFDTIKETFNGEHKTLFDVIKDTIKKLSNFVSENHDAIVEILTALLELQATVIEAVVNAILSIAKWLVEHKDTVVKVLNRIEDIVDWLGKHIGVVIGFYLAIKTLSILSSAVTWVTAFVKAIGTMKAALNMGGAASAAGTGGGGLFRRIFGRGTSTGTPTTTPTTTSTMPNIGGARSTDLGGNTTAGAAGATGATGLKAFATKAALPAAGVTAAIVGSDWELRREHNKLVEQSQDWRGLSEEVRKTEMALAKVNGQGFTGTGADATSLESGGFFGLFKTVGSYFDKGDTPLNTEFVAQKAKEKAEEIKNILDGEKTTYKRIEELLEDINIAKQFKDLGYGEEVTNAAIDHFRAVLYSELEDSIDKNTNKLSDDAIKVNSHINDYVKKVSKSSVESQYKLKATVDSSINTINNSTNTMKRSLSSVHSGINNANSTMQNILSTSINSVDLLRLNVNTLSTDVQGLNADTSYTLSAIRSVISSASSALSGVMSGVMSTIGGAVGIPSVRNIFGFANGGVPKSGQMFIAREDGMPELVGNFGGYSGVANNDMIVRAMHDAIYDGMRAAGAGSNTYGGNGGTVNFNNYGYFGGDRASFRQFAEMINNANKSSDSNIANRSFRS